MEMNLHPLPQQQDYTEALEHIHETFAEQGGPWVAAMREEQRATYGTVLYDTYLLSGTLGYEVEPLDANEMPLDSLLRTTHAFKHGMLVGFKVIKILHHDLIEPDEVVRYIDTAAPEERGSYARASHIIELGEQGLEIAGPAAKDQVETWGNDIVTDARVRRMYGLGCGAVLFAAYRSHVGYNEFKMAEYFEQYRWQG